MQGPPFVQGTTIRDVFDPSAVQDELLFCHKVFKFIYVELGKSPLLGDVDLLAARELELGPAEGFNHMFLVLQLGVDGHYDLGTVYSGHCALGLSKGTAHTCLESISSSARQHLVDTDDMEGVETYWDVKTIFATAFHHVLVGTNMGSLQASEESCSYSYDTMWPQSGNSSTLAFLRPKSKMRILASGTPRQKRDFGYGLFLQYR